MEDGVHEECGITGVYFKNPDLSPRLLPGYKYSMLRMVQHRGQLSAGAAVFDDIKNGEYLKLVTEVGRVKDLFKENREQEHQRKEVQRYLQGRAGIGHVRYATSGRRKLSYFDLKRQAQPFLRDHPRPEKSFAESFNGNLANYSKLRADIVNEGYRLKTKVDTEVIVYLLSHSINALSGKDKKGNFVPANIFRVFEQVTSVLDGAYDLLTLFGDGNLAIVRDPRGFKPLVYGENKDLFAVASESIALEKIGIRKFRPVEPGACMVFNPERGLEQKIITKAPRRAYCHFERTYFCRANSIVDGKSINSSREGMGIILQNLIPIKDNFQRIEKRF